LTVLETIIGGVILSIFSSLLTLVISNKNKVSMKEFEKHRDSTNPHVACPVHETKLQLIEKKLDKMDEKLDLLIQKV